VENRAPGQQSTRRIGIRSPEQARASHCGAGRERARPENRKSITGQEGDAGFFSLPLL
jgi:hypothetical protein